MSTDGLLRWANRFTRGHDHIEPVQDWSDSWANGLAFCALVYNWFPDNIPINELKADTEKDCINNCNLAFKVAKEEAGIENLLDGEDIVLIQDKKSIILYVSEIYGRLHEEPQKFTCPPEWDRNYERKQTEAKIAEKKAQMEAAKLGKAHFSFSRGATVKGGVASKFFEKTTQSEPASPSVTRKEEEDTVAAASAPVSPDKPVHAKDRVNAEPKKEEEEKKHEEPKQEEFKKPVGSARPSVFSKREEEKKQEIKITPKNEKKTKAPEPVDDTPYNPVDGVLTYSISGKGKDGGQVGRMLIFTTNLQFNGGTLPFPPPKKDDLVVHIEAPGETVRCTVMGGTGGSYHVGFTPPTAGEYWVDFEWRNLFCDKPFRLPISTAEQEVPTHPYEGGERKRHQTNKESGSTVPRGSAASDATPAHEPLHVKDTKNAPVTPSKLPESEKPAKIAEKISNNAPPVAANCTAEGPGVTGISDIDNGEFVITARDAKGNLTSGKADFQVRVLSGPSKPKASITAVGDGTHKVNYGVIEAGKYIVDVVIGPTHIKGSPFKLTVTESVSGGELAELTILFQTFAKNGDKLTEGGNAQFITVETGADNEDDDQPQLLDLADGKYTLDYEAQPGENSINISVGGISISGCPINFTI